MAAHSFASFTGRTDLPVAVVTGGAGFVGSHLSERLLAGGFRVICIDNLQTGRMGNILPLLDNPHFAFRRHDVIDPLKLPFRHIARVYNLAAAASPPLYQRDPIHTLQTNVMGALNVLELARRSGARIFQASTSEVYGDPEVHPQPETYHGNVNCYGPRACYDEGKRTAETAFFEYRRLHAVDTRIARIFNTYGPRMSPDDGRVVSNFVVQALRGQDITIYGDGSQTRSFCFVDDLVEGIQRLMAADIAPAGPVNLGNPGEFTMVELAELVLELTGSRSRLVYRPLPQDDPRQRRPDIRVAKALLDWSPTVRLRDGLIRTIAHFDAELAGARTAEMALYMKQALLITGGAGFIGSHTAKQLAAAGYLPVVVDNLSTGHRDAVRWGPLVEADIRDTDALVAIMRLHQPQAVIHFAAHAYVGESVRDPTKYYRNNVEGTRSLLDACYIAGVDKLIFSSSCATYGVPDVLPIREDAPQHPINPYGRTKLVGEHMLADCAVAHGLKYVALRYFNAAGADPEGELGEQHEPETHLIPRALLAAYGQLPYLEVFGSDLPTPDGTCVRDYIHVTDLARAHVMAAAYLIAGGATTQLNLGTGRGTSVREVLDAVERVTGHQVPAVMRPARAGDPPTLFADGSRAREVLGFVPELSDLDTIMRTAAPFFVAETRHAG